MSDSGLSFPDQPRVELDQRLSDLVLAANQVLATQGRLRALLRANQAITAQLDLESVLRSIVEAARDLTGAQYAALGVIGEHGGLVRFLHEGMDEEHVRLIGHLPVGEGLLGAVIRDPHPIRITDIATDPRSAGFPEHHPEMRDFLGVPIRVRGAVYGNLYLTNHPEGRFTEEDDSSSGRSPPRRGSPSRTPASTGRPGAARNGRPPRPRSPRSSSRATAGTPWRSSRSACARSPTRTAPSSC